MANQGLTRFEDRQRLPLGISVNFNSLSAKLLTQVKILTPLRVEHSMCYLQPKPFATHKPEALNHVIAWFQLQFPAMIYLVSPECFRGQLQPLTACVLQLLPLSMPNVTRCWNGGTHTRRWQSTPWR